MLEICRTLELEDVIFVGHSVIAIIGLQASPDTGYLGWSVAMAPVIPQ